MKRRSVEPGTGDSRSVTGWVRVGIGSVSALAAVGAAGFAISLRPTTSSDSAVVDQQVVAYRSATCGCCKGWLQHLQAAGFNVRDHVVDDLAAVTRSQGVPGDLASCHTATVGGYVIEGHVPVSAIQRLLRERPAVVGIAVPGMPLGSPGMESPVGAEPYTVFSFTSDGAYRPFQRIEV